MKTILEVDYQQPYRPTIIKVEFWFDILNYHIFDNELSSFNKIVIGNTTSGQSWGWVEYDFDSMPDTDVDLRLHCVFPDTYHFISVLGHEMVHLYQVLYCNTGCHNRMFFSFIPRFKELGLKLSRNMDHKPMKIR